ncbi:MAG: DNA polymerase III subunit delta [Prevotella sp.]|nr:DNA polymerase III subunit delta [Prevotella sp.]MBQ6162303.1 DNA polymerase III subunit delta [Prevotella sp.]MBQ6186356.1 DNA polymerase III subunit delta [Prevotella sp.]
MEFSEVIGQQEVKDRLMKMVEEGRVPHAIMLCGPTGTGKMALAMAFASYLLTEGSLKINSDTNVENAKAMVRVWSHPDLHFTFPVIRPPKTSSDHSMESDDFAREWREMISQGPYFTFDQWLRQMDAANQQAIIFEGESDALTRKLSLKSSQGGYKVSVIWLPEKMNAACANKLLKLIEEPPQQTVFIMVSEEPALILETIRSRTQRIDVRRIDTADIEQALIDRRGLDNDTAHRVARAAMGSWTKAIDSLTEDSEDREFFELFVTLMRLAYQRDVKGLKAWSDGIYTLGREKQKRMLDYFARMVRENFIYNFHNPDLNYMNAEEENFARKFSKFINEANVIYISEQIEKARKGIGQNANAKVLFYDFALRMIVLLIKR